METTLKKAEKLLESLAAKSENQTIERAKGLALVVIAKRIGRVASNLELVATQLKVLSKELSGDKIEVITAIPRPKYPEKEEGKTKNKN